MASYLRSLFRGGSSASKDDNSTRSPKSHQRSHSTSLLPPAQSKNLNYFYTEPVDIVSSSPAVKSTPNTPSNSSMPARSTAPSPLRYGTHDLSSLRSQSQYRHQAQATPSYSSHPYPHSGKVPIYRTSSHQTGERPPLYPLEKHKDSFSSTRSSNSSIYAVSSSSHRPPPSRTPSSGSVPSTSEPRPALKHSNAWQGNSKSGPHAHVSFQNPNRHIPTHIHPVLASTRLHRAPICYDITYTPSSFTVLDRHTLAPIPAHTLAQPATEPPITDKLVLKADNLPWSIVVSSSKLSERDPNLRKPRFYLGDSDNRHPSSSPASPITNLDILYALHTSLSLRITQKEWESLGHGSRAQRKVTRAYEKRCKTLGGGWEAGVRRIDFLEGKTRLIGVDMALEKGDGDSNVGRLAFAKA